MCGFVSSGIGVAICDPFTASEFATRGVVARPFRPRIPFEFGALYPPGPSPSRVAEEFVAEFARHIEAFAATLETDAPQPPPRKPRIRGL